MRDGESNQIHEPLGEHGESTQVDEKFVGADDCDSSADEQLPATNEVDFKMTSLFSSLANSSIISNLCWLLKFYKSNSTATNHYILCLLRRISDDLDLAPMLYQLSLLVVFYDILNEQKACPRKEYENIVKFLTTLVRRMLRKMKDQPLLFVDVLFWKTRKDCHYINVESIKRDVGEMRKEVRNWGNADETGAPQGKESTRKSLADALGDDEYDVIIPPNQNRNEKDEDSDEAADEVLHTSGPRKNNREDIPLEVDFQEVKKRKRRLVHSEKLEEDILGLYEKYKDNLNCTQLIAEALDPDGNISAAQISRKCKKLGIKLASKKSNTMAHLSNDNDQDKEGKSQIDSSLQDSGHADRPSYPGRPMQARKRIRALDEMQELKIRSLFENFKDHKRCSQMIAKELDPNGSVTAAQVSRKLKKFGLRTSRMKIEEERQKMDAASTDGEEDSDNLTLSQARKRKNRENSSSYKDLDSMKNVQSPGSDSDDELVLSSILQKAKRVQTEVTEREDKHAEASDDQDTIRANYSNQISPSSEKREIRGEAADVDVDIQRSNIPTSIPEHQADRYNKQVETGNQNKNDELSPSSIPGSDQASDSTPDKVDSVQDEQKYVELEDSEDEQPPSVSADNSVKRRKLRVVMDYDDDDD